MWLLIYALYVFLLYRQSNFSEVLAVMFQGQLAQSLAVRRATLRALASSHIGSTYTILQNRPIYFGFSVQLHVSFFFFFFRASD